MARIGSRPAGRRAAGDDVAPWVDAELLEPLETEPFDEGDALEEGSVCLEPAPGLAVSQRGQVMVGDRKPFSRNGERIAHIARDGIRNALVQGGEVLAGELGLQHAGAGVGGTTRPVAAVGREMR